MVPETGIAAAVAAALSTASLALFGVDYYSLLYALVGALLALPHAEQMGRTRAIVYVMLSVLAGAAIGNCAVLYLHLTSRPMLILACLGGGLLAQALAAFILKNAGAILEAFISRWRGKQT
jgi:hypothetical protein